MEKSDGQKVKRCVFSAGACMGACSWTDLQNFHGRLPHSRLFVGRDMVAGSATVQKVPGPPLAFLPVDLTPATDRRRLLSETNLPRSREGLGSLRALEEAGQALGRAAGRSPPKSKEGRVEQVRLNSWLVGKRVNSIAPAVWAIVADYNMTTEREGSQRFFY